MRSLPIEDSSWDEPDKPARTLTLVGAPSPRPAAAEAGPPVQGGRWSDRRGGINWPCAGIAIGFNVLLLAALVTMDVVPVPFAKPKPMVVKMFDLPKDPPPAAPQEAKVEPVRKIQPPIIAPKALVQTLAMPAPVLTAPEPPPVRATVVAPVAKPTGPSGPLSVGDLDSKMISAKPPRYPIESRRNHEQGTVVLTVLLSTSGSVSDVSVARSSGSPRLDRAALDAVRRWLWSPTVVNGEPVMVRGIVEIPFVLQG